MPKDAESGGSNFTEKVTALWPPGRPRTEVPSFERTTVKAHVLAHVARSRRKPGAVAPDVRPEFALPWDRKRPDLPLPPSGELPRGSQTTPRLDGDEAPPAVVVASAPVAPAAQAAPAEVGASEYSGPRFAPAASAADAWDERDASGAGVTAMPPLYAGISPYRHVLPATLFELTAVSSAPQTAPAPAMAPVRSPDRSARPGRSRRRAHAGPARRAARARRALHSRALPVLVFLLAVFLSAAAYWQTWTALSMTERCRGALQMLSSTFGSSPADDHPGHGPGI